MKIEELNTIRAAVREPVADILTACIPNLVRIPHENEFYLPSTTPDGTPCYVKIAIGVPNWYDTAKTEAFSLTERIEKAEADFNEKERKKAEAEAKKSEKGETETTSRVDNTEYDEKVLSYLREHTEAISAADLYEAHEWDLDNKETKGKMISALSRLAKANKVSKIASRGASLWLAKEATEEEENE